MGSVGLYITSEQLAVLAKGGGVEGAEPHDIIIECLDEDGGLMIHAAEHLLGFVCEIPTLLICDEGHCASYWGKGERTEL